jgi:hypothetical protein
LASSKGWLPRAEASPFSEQIVQFQFSSGNFLFPLFFD